MTQTLVSTKYQVVIPKKIRKVVGIKPGQRMDVETNGVRVVLTPSKSKKDWLWPDDYIKNLANPWEGEDVNKYIEDERNSWD